MQEEQNAALVRRAVVEIWNEGKLDLVDILFAADYINHAGLIPDMLRGPEAIKFSVALYRAAFPNFHIAMDKLTAKRDAVVLRWTARSNSQLAGSTAGARHSTLKGIIVSRCAGGQIMESWTHWNQAGVLAELGIAHQAKPRHNQ